MTTLRLHLGCLAAASLLGCTVGEAGVDAGPGPGSGSDAGPALPDAAPAQRDAASPGTDGGTVGSDAGPIDAGPADAAAPGSDAGVDSGVGAACDDVYVSVGAAGRGRNVPAPGGPWAEWRDVDAIGVADAAPGHAGTTDNVAQVRLSGSRERTDYLVADGFGFDLDPSRSVLGVEVVFVRASDREDTLADFSVELVDRGTVLTGGATPSPYAWSSAGFMPVTYGDPADRWGHAWTPELVNDPGFGVALRVRYASTAGNDDAQVDLVELRVHHGRCP